MLTDIEDKVIARLNEKISEPKRMSIDEAHHALTVPAIDVITGGGSFRKVAQNYKFELSVFVIVTFQHLRSVEDRRKGVYPILEAIIASLVLQTLELKIDPLIPKRLENITEKEEAEDGKIIFQIEFETGFIFNKLSNAEINDLVTISLNYYLESTDSATATDEVITIEVAT